MKIFLVICWNLRNNYYFYISNTNNNNQNTKTMTNSLKFKKDNSNQNYLSLIDYSSKIEINGTEYNFRIQKDKGYKYFSLKVWKVGAMVWFNDKFYSKSSTEEIANLIAYSISENLVFSNTCSDWVFTKFHASKNYQDYCEN